MGSLYPQKRPVTLAVLMDTLKGTPEHCYGMPVHDVFPLCEGVWNGVQYVAI